ncbi:MAG: glycosyltransferase family 39 protein [Anaerolineae bacterium]|nr:glycosyltransferase family 39 protein [Anaerolineae bacterium]
MFHLGHLGIWLDESYSIYTAQQDALSFFQFMASMEHPPLYFLLLRAVIEIAGPNALGFRFLSVISGLLGVVGTYLLAKRLFGLRLSLGAALLMAISPLHIWYAQEARMYELAFTLGLFSCYFFLKGLEQNGKRIWIGYGLASLAGLYTLNIIALVFLVQWIYFFLHVRRYAARLKPLFLTTLAIGLGYAVWLPVLLFQSQHVNQYFWIARPTWCTIRDTLLNFSSAFLFSNSPWHPSLGTRPFNLVYLAFPLAVLAGVVVLIKHKQLRALSLAALIFALPIGIVYAASLIKPVYLDRTVLFASEGLLLLIAAGCLGFQKGWARIVGLGLLCVIVGTNGVSVYNLYTTGEKEEWNLAAQLVADNVRENDLILIDSGLGQIPFDLYFRDHHVSVPTRGYPLDNDHWRSQEWTLNSRWWILDFMDIDRQAARERLDALLAQSARVWLVVNRPLGGEPLQRTLAEHSDGAPAVYHFNRVDVILYP